MPPRRTTPQGYAKARQLRKSLTPAERKLWAILRGDKLGVNFRRQHAIGPYIADFACIQKKLIIELDGSQHLEQKEYDEQRTRYLNALGYRVIRFWNNEVMTDMDGVIRAIRLALDEHESARPS
ncbi:MAG: endonuclease domain-containing protein [Anaerolineales bacterium]|nr:endonuclease domain-containing protein [Anaerolineales bacterium]